MDELNVLSDDEKRRLKLQRERSNKISQIMGDYLLKGYKMLGTTCNKCQTILLQDRQGDDYCIGCVEVDVQSITTPDTALTHQQSSTVHTDTCNSSSSQSNKSLLDVSVRNIRAQIQWTNDSLASSNLTLEQRTQLVVFLRTCYETLNILMQS